jgi:hypothetical protein
LVRKNKVRLTPSSCCASLKLNSTIFVSSESKRSPREVRIKLKKLSILSRLKLPSAKKNASKGRRKKIRTENQSSARRWRRRLKNARKRSEFQEKETTVGPINRC